MDAPSAGQGQPRDGMLLDYLMLEERARVLEAGEIKVYWNGEYVVEQGTPSDGLHLIRAGLVESVCEELPGRELTLAYWSSGDFIGAPNILSGRPHIWLSKAIGCVETLWLSRGGAFRPDRQLARLLDRAHPMPVLQGGMLCEARPDARHPFHREAAGRGPPVLRAQLRRPAGG